MDIAVETGAATAGTASLGTRDWVDLLEDIPAAALILTGITPRRMILGMNDRSGRLFGYERAEVVDQPLTLLMPSPLHELGASSPDWPVEDGTVTSCGRRRDGSQFPIEVRCTTPYPGMGVAGIAIVRDVSAGSAAQRLLAAQRDAALNASKGKSQFLAAASHDLRQPLQTIWTMQAILARALAQSEYAEPLAAIEDAVRNMDQMLSSILDINRLEAGAIDPVIEDFPLRDILPRLHAEFAYGAARKAVTLDVEDCAEFARSDRSLLPVILRNLLGNAIKYTQHGWVRLRVRASGDQLHIEVRDTGIGIAPENLRRLFDAFYQVENAALDGHEGVGLGLSIVQQFSKVLDHRISVESRIGEGSTFTVRLPRGVAGARGPNPCRVAIPMPAPPAGAPRVLHIEDDPAVARAIALLLRLEGYEVLSAATRDEAMRYIKGPTPPPDLVLSDYRLPMGFRGDAIIAEIVAWLGFKPPTIMLTGDTTDGHIAQVMRIADRILPKPVDVNLLLREISSLLDGSHRAAAAIT